MLALGVDNGPRGTRGVRGQGGRVMVDWSSPRGQAVNIKQKISQWEGLNQGDEGQVTKTQTHRPAVVRTFSGDVLGSGSCGEARSKATTLGLDFREAQAGRRNLGAGRRSDPQKNHLEAQRTSTLFQKPLTSPGQRLSPDESQLDKALRTNGEQMSSNLPPLPHFTEDPEDDLPPGNFYTSRGFWRKLEMDDSLWEKKKNSPTFANHLPSEESPAPPKPQRTFQYKGAEQPAEHWVQWENRTPSPVKSRPAAGPPLSCPPPPCPGTRPNGFTRHGKNRKSFEFEDAARLAAQQGARGSEARRSGLYHALSEDNIYEDIISDLCRESPYEDVKFSPMCLPIARVRPWTVTQRQTPRTPKLPPKLLTLQANGDKLQRAQQTETLVPHTQSLAQTPGPKRCARNLRFPQYVTKIQEIFQAKRGWKRVKSHTATMRGTQYGLQHSFQCSKKCGSQRLVYVQSTLRWRPGYRTLEKDLIQLQQRQLFQLFAVVSLRKSSPGNMYSPVITQQFPNKLEKSSRLSREAEDRLKAIPKFCFPDSQDWKPSADLSSETFSFVLTGEDGSRWFGYCRKILPKGKGKRLPEVHCIVSRLGCFNLFAKILEEVERRREISPALVHPFMRSVMEAPFPAPGRTITVKSFLPGSGNEVLTLCRPVDSRLEHVDFESLLQCLSVGQLLQVFSSLLLERRVIFISDKLGTLSRCAHSALGLLYPFTWQHTFVPVLPVSMLDICCSPTPFLMGVLSPTLPELLELPIEEVLIVDLRTDSFVVQLGDEDCILPSKLQAALQEILEDREQILGQSDNSTEESALSALVSEAFVRFFVELVGHYSLHMSEVAGGGARELQRESFRKSHPSRGVRQFLQLFMDTQMFAGFIQDRELRKGGVKGLFEVRAAEYLESNPEPEPSGVNKFLKGLGKAGSCS
uniref:UDENN domain-containing protein n=1 Tax=Denticeps clupeoides TaxID=299321 RepID=A0AAY4DNM1_9TELE